MGLFCHARMPFGQVDRVRVGRPGQLLSRARSHQVREVRGVGSAGVGENDGVPELPEVQALVDFLAERTDGLAVTGVELGVVRGAQDLRPAAAGARGRAGRRRRRGTASSSTSTATACTWSSTWPAPAGCAGPTRCPTPCCARASRRSRCACRFSDGSGFDLTEAGTKKWLAAYIVRDPGEVPGIASPRPRPDGRRASPARRSRRCSSGRRTQIKGLLRDQEFIAGVGNAYSDEILHVAKMSPFAMACAASTRSRSTGCMPRCARPSQRAVGAASGKPAKELKDAKRAGMRVHGRTGEPCPVCGDIVREVSFADSSLQYCATCQTGGKPLADRRMSRLLK